MSTGMIVGGDKPSLIQMQDFVRSLGSDIAKSQMFGCENPAQANIMALACVVSGRDPLSIPMEFHVLKGRLSLKAEAMLGRLIRDGGQYEIIEHSPNAAEIKVENRGRKFHERFTWEEAQEETFVYSGDPKVILKALKEGKKDTLQFSFNYSTPRKRMQMLWSRVVSDAVRVVAPHVLGAYTPEEVSDYSGFALPAAAASKVVDEVKHGGTESTEVQTQTVAETVAEEVEEASVELVKLASSEQVKAIDAMFKVLGMSEAVVSASLAKRNVGSLDKLPFDVAAEFLKALEERHAKVAAANPTEAGQISVSTEGPITQELLEQLVEKFKAAAQRDSKLVTRVKEKLQANGLKMSELTFDQGRVLLSALKGEEIEKFFELPLVKAEPKLEPVASDDPVPDV